MGGQGSPGRGGSAARDRSSPPAPRRWLAPVCSLGVILALAGPVRAQCPPRSDLFPSNDSFTLADPAAHVVVEDFNGDGVPDLAMGGSGNRVTIMLGAEVYGRVVFGDPRDVPAGPTPYGFTSGDFNGDGVPDLAIAASDGDLLFIYVGSGTGSDWTMTQVAAYTTPERPISVAAGDINGDGSLDLVVSNALASSISVFIGRGDGRFGSRSDYFCGGPPGEVVLADVNKDGLLDIVTANYTRSGVGILLGNGASGTGGGMFRAFSVDRFGTGGLPVSIRLADFDGDGIMDCAVTRTQTQGLELMQGQNTAQGFRFVGVGSLDPGGSNLSSPNPRGLSIADVDGDGHLDIATVLPIGVIGATYKKIAVYYGDGSFGFTRVDYPGPDQASAIEAADLDGDNAVDLVAVGLGASYTVAWGACPAGPPTIASFEPRAGAVGDTVTLRGGGFKLVAHVRFNGVLAEILARSVSTLTVRVPAGATSGPITVQSSTGTGASVSSFIVGEKPQVLGFVPDHAKPGHTITVLGIYLTGTEEVHFGTGPPASFEVVADTALLAAVDTLARTGPVSVRTLIGRGVSAIPFTVVPLDTAPRIEAVRDVPQDQGGQVTVSWEASDFDVVGRGLIGGYVVLRRIPPGDGAARALAASRIPRDASIWRTLSPPGAGAGLAASGTSPGAGARQAPPVSAIPRGASVRRTLSPPGAGAGRALAASGPSLPDPREAWEPIASVPASYLPSYAVTAATRGDSTSAGIPYETFAVRAYSADSSATFESPPDSGFSVDNLAPDPPAGLTARHDLDRVELQWQANAETDLFAYAVHRGDHAGFEIGPENVLAVVHEPRYVDTPGRGDYFYRVVAIDAHGNRSLPAEIKVEGLPLPTRFEVARLGPNPASDRLELVLALPSKDPVRLEAIDLAGRRVLQDRVTLPDAGFQRIAWSAVARLRPGVYFVRLEQGAHTVARRIVVSH